MATQDNDQELLALLNTAEEKGLSSQEQAEQFSEQLWNFFDTEPVKFKEPKHG